MADQMTQAGHGDLYMRRIPETEVPEAVRQRLQDSGTARMVLAEGEVTGHKHLLTSELPIGYVKLDDTRAYVLLRDAGLLTHEEHGERVMAPGWYEVPTERDYDPALYERRVVD